MYVHPAASIPISACTYYMNHDYKVYSIFGCLGNLDILLYTTEIGKDINTAGSVWQFHNFSL